MYKLTYLVLNSAITLSLLAVGTLPKGLFQTNSDPHGQVTQEIMRLLETGGELPYEEEGMSQLDHVLECAYNALRSGADEESVLAALLHDVGRYWVQVKSEELEGISLRDEDVEGARFLRDRGFSSRICGTISGHIDMMRYQAYAHPDTFANFPSAMHRLVEMKGGAMSPKEAAAFEQNPYFRDMLTLHDCDLHAHTAGVDVPPLEMYESLIRHHLEKQCVGLKSRTEAIA